MYQTETDRHTHTDRLKEKKGETHKEKKIWERETDTEIKRN